MIVARLAILTCLAGMVPCGASNADGNVEAGEDLAKEWCARCHDISPAGAFKQSPPSFAAIAAFRAHDDIRWRIQYPPPHTSMPRIGFYLDHKALEDLTAFIISLEKSDN